MSLVHDRNTVLEFVKQKPKCVKSLPPHFRNDREIVQIASGGGNGNLLRWASPTLQNDRDLVKMAITQSLRHDLLVTKFKNDRELIMTQAKAGDLHFYGN